eukprot:gene10599-11745_t
MDALEEQKKETIRVDNEDEIEDFEDDIWKDVSSVEDEEALGEGEEAEEEGQEEEEAQGERRRIAVDKLEDPLQSALPPATPPPSTQPVSPLMETFTTPLDNIRLATPAAEEETVELKEVSAIELLKPRYVRRMHNFLVVVAVALLATVCCSILSTSKARWRRVVLDLVPTDLRVVGITGEDSSGDAMANRSVLLNIFEEKGQDAKEKSIASDPVTALVTVVEQCPEIGSSGAEAEEELTEQVKDVALPQEEEVLIEEKMQSLSSLNEVEATEAEVMESDDGFVAQAKERNEIESSASLPLECVVENSDFERKQVVQEEPSVVLFSNSSSGDDAVGEVFDSIVFNQHEEQENIGLEPTPQSEQDLEENELLSSSDVDKDEKKVSTEESVDEEKPVEEPSQSAVIAKQLFNESVLVETTKEDEKVKREEDEAVFEEKLVGVDDEMKLLPSESETNVCVPTEEGGENEEVREGEEITGEAAPPINEQENSERIVKDAVDNTLLSDSPSSSVESDEGDHDVESKLATEEDLTLPSDKGVTNEDQPLPVDSLFSSREEEEKAPIFASEDPGESMELMDDPQITGSELCSAAIEGDPPGPLESGSEDCLSEGLLSVPAVQPAGPTPSSSLIPETAVDVEANLMESSSTMDDVHVLNEQGSLRETDHLHLLHFTSAACLISATIFLLGILFYLCPFRPNTSQPVPKTRAFRDLEII